MFEDRETMGVDILVVLFLVGICTIIYGGIVRDAVVIGIGGILLFSFIFLLWIIKRFRKH